MTLRAQVVDFVGLNFKHEIRQGLAIGKIAIVEQQLGLIMNISIQMIDPTCRKVLDLRTSPWTR